MDNLKALGRGTQVMFIAAVLLLIVMFFHWQDFGRPPSAPSSFRMRGTASGAS